jgi:hypothetical protein
VIWEEHRDFPIGRYRFVVEGRAQKGGQTTSYHLTSSPFEVRASRRLNVYGLRVSGGQIEGRISDPPVAPTSLSSGRRVIDENAGHLLQSPLVPSFIGAPIPESLRLTVSGTIRRGQDLPVPISGTIPCTTVIEPRRRIAAYDANGAPEWQDGGMYPTSKFAIDSTTLAQGPAGNYVVALSVRDLLGNAGTVTATITK